MKTLVLAAAMFTALASNAAAEVVVMDFDQLDGSVSESPLTYYAGGAGSAGTSGGPDYGISFSANGVTGCNASSFCGNTDADLSPSFPNIFGFVGGPGADIMNVAGGFDTRLSFFYSAPYEAPIILPWTGLNGAGTLLAAIALPLTPPIGGSCSADFCPFEAYSASFSGVAHSVDFSYAAGDVVFDNITLETATDGGAAVPEPATWWLMIAGFGLAGAAVRRRHRARRTGRAEFARGPAPAVH